MLGRVRSDWRFLSAVWLLVASAVTLVVAATLYGDVVGAGAIRTGIERAAPADQAILVRTSAAPGHIELLDATLRARLEAALAVGGGGHVDLVARSPSLAPIGLAPATMAAHLTILASFEDLAAHATLVHGRWPVAGHEPIEATLSTAAAATLGLNVSDAVSLADASTPGANPNSTVDRVVVVGIWRAEASDPYWLGDPLETEGVVVDGATTLRGPFALASADVLRAGRFASLDLQWRALPNMDQITANELPPLRDAVLALSTGIGAGLPANQPVTITTGLATLLASVAQASLASRAEVLLLTLQFAVLATYAVLLVAGLLLERRRLEVALLRSRGASNAQIVLLALAEGFILALPAALVALPAGLAAVTLLGRAGPLAETGLLTHVTLDRDAFAVTVLALLGSAAALTLPALPGGELAGVRAALGRPFARTLPQRLGLDLAILAVATIGLWQLRTYGAPLATTSGGTLGIDPLLVAAPAFALLAGAVLAVRIVPRIGEVAERLLDVRRGVATLAARQLARRPLRYTRFAVLLILAAALGTFSTVYASTLDRSKRDQAAYQTAADVRVTPPTDFGALPDWALGPVYRAIPGVTEATPVADAAFSVGRVIRQGPVLGLAPTAAARALATAPDGLGIQAGGLLQRLSATVPGSAGVPLPGEPTRLAVTIDADVHAPSNAAPGVGPEPGEIGIEVTVDLLDGDGRIVQFASPGGARLLGTGQRVVIPLTASADARIARPAYPLRLVGIGFDVGLIAGEQAVGALWLQSLATSPSQAGPDFTTLALGLANPDWQWLEGGQQLLGQQTVTPRDGVLVVGTDAAPLDGWGADLTFLYMADPGAAAMPVLASDQFLALTGSHVGDIVHINLSGASLEVRVLAGTTLFPPLDPGQPFLVADGSVMGLALLGATGSVSRLSEWWVTTRPGAETAVAAALVSAPHGASSVVTRPALTSSLVGDPLALGVVGALALGAVAALIFALVSFLVGAAVSASERETEFALLEALGLGRGQLRRWLTFEQSLLLLVGAGGGIALGLLLAWLVLPSATLSEVGAPPVPPAVVVVPWQVFGAAAAIAAALLLMATWVGGRAVPAAHVPSVLRALEE